MTERQRCHDDVVASRRLPFDRQGAVREMELPGEREARDPEELGDRRGDDPRVAVGRLDAADHQVEGLPLDRGGQHAGRDQRVGASERVVGDPHALVGAHREAALQRRLRDLGAHREERDLAVARGLDELQGRFQPVLIAGIERPVRAFADQKPVVAERRGALGLRHPLRQDDDVHAGVRRSSLTGAPYPRRCRGRHHACRRNESSSSRVGIPSRAPTFVTESAAAAVARCAAAATSNPSARPLRTRR